MLVCLSCTLKRYMYSRFLSTLRNISKPARANKYSSGKYVRDMYIPLKKVQIGNDQEMSQSERHSTP